MDDLDLHVEYARQAESLQVTYTATNKGSKPLWVLDVLWRYTERGQTVPDARGAYVSLSPEKVARIARIIHPSPKLKRVEQTIVPFARKLDAGASRKEAFSLPLPLHECSPYYGDGPNTQWADLETDGVEFWLSWIVEDENLQAHDSPIEGAFRLQDPRLLAKIQTAKSGRTALRVPAKRRLDTFERF